MPTTPEKRAVMSGVKGTSVRPTPIACRLRAMTVRELLAQLESFEPLVLGYLVAVPLLSLITGWLHRPGQGAEGWTRYLYALLVYLACIPGTLAAALLAYALFISHDNLLDLSLTLYVLPVVSMGAALGIMSRRVNFDDVPGFERLSGLMLMMALSFGFVFFLERTRIWILFGGSVMLLAALFFSAMALMKKSAKRAFGSRDDGEDASRR